VSKAPWFLAVLIVAASQTVQAAWTETILTHFSAESSGSYDGLVFDGKGNLYGTNVASGAKGYGSVFKLTPPGPGKAAWTKTDIYSFKGAEGARPYARLILDAAGNLYGTTRDGGPSGSGMVFRLTPPVAGKAAWTLTVLHSFNGADGRYPVSALVFGQDGNLYGTTEYGGAKNLGTAFKLTKPAAKTGPWLHTMLHNFDQTDGAEIVGGLVFDGGGNLYGTASAGGLHKLGVVFKLAHPAAGKTAWAESTLYHFASCTCDGANPQAALTIDGSGNLYGTTNGGGTGGYGTIFRLAPPVKGKPGWTEGLLYSFAFANGIYPDGNLTLDVAGNLYGTTSEGGASKNGTVFKLNHPAAGTSRWTETTLHVFGPADGAVSYSNVIFDKAGSLYGTTSAGGEPTYQGIVFKLTR
jgi:uncharacterized repeat protein (TIGR03803 family)